MRGSSALTFQSVSLATVADCMAHYFTSHRITSHITHRGIVFESKFLSLALSPSLSSFTSIGCERVCMFFLLSFSALRTVGVAVFRFSFSFSSTFMLIIHFGCFSFIKRKKTCEKQQQNIERKSSERARASTRERAKWVILFALEQRTHCSTKPYSVSMIARYLYITISRLNCSPFVSCSVVVVVVFHLFISFIFVSQLNAIFVH